VHHQDEVTAAIVPLPNRLSSHFDQSRQILASVAFPVSTWIDYS
jgi:hypothetical protein